MAKTTTQIQEEYNKLLEQRNLVDQELLKLQGEFRYAYTVEQEAKKDEPEDAPSDSLVEEPKEETKTA